MDIILLSTADWDHPFWTNKQHVAVSMAELGHRVFYIESLGLRAPTVRSRDVRRLFRRLLLACRPPRHVRPHIWVWSPLVIPATSHRVLMGMNRLILRSSLWFWLTLLRFRKQLFWTYNPLAFDFFEIHDYQYSVYHCVDAIDAQPGMPSARIRSGEVLTCRAVDVVFTTSPLLQQRCLHFNHHTYFYGNVADSAHFQRALSVSEAIPADLLAIPSPRIGFVGAISAYKLDVPLLLEVALRHSDWSFVLIGAIGEGQSTYAGEDLRGIPNIHLMGPREYDSLPGYMKGFQVGIIPAALNDYTQAMFPMKFFEYLAAGLPVVSTRLSSLIPFSDCVFFADSDPDSLASAVEDALRMGDQMSELCLQVASEHTYKARTRDMLAFLETLPKDLAALDYKTVPRENL